MDWKDDLGNFFSVNGIYRLNYLNLQLNSWCKEWITYISEFDGIHAELKLLVTFEENNNRIWDCKFIKVKNSNTAQQPFKSYIKFIPKDGHLCLFIKTTKSWIFEPSVFLQGKEMDSDEKYNWHEETEISDKEIVEQGFVLQLLNNRFKGYFEV